MVAREKNCYLFDLDSLSSAFGKRFVFDDVVAITGHGGYLSDYDAGKDQNRIEAPVRLSMQQEFKTWEFMDVIWAELFAMHGTLAREDSVKLLVTDLDDTLWRGVIGEGDFHDGGIEGWPLGYMEALLVLKQRGILLGIISKNTREIVEEKWNIATGGRIKLSDFAVTRINWKPKVENMASILADVNLLPKNVVYVDDNPVERHAMADAFPGIRVLGDNPYSLKRILLWSAETQVPVITPEGAKRTEMVQAQVRRNEDMGTMSRDVFLKSLELKVDVNIVPAQADRRFQRSFELINKTNQFNTTGKRWSLVEIGEVLERGGFMVTFDIVDRYTNYGLVGVLIVQGDEILQYVMSCRVIGLDVETTVLRALAHRLMIADRGQVVARVIETPANIVCRDVFSRAGFEAADGRWVLRKDPGGAPPHIALAWGEGVVPAPAVDAMNRLHNMAL